MQKKTSLYTALENAKLMEKYDKRVKNILSHRIVLAWILKEAVEEVRGFTVEEIVTFIEPEIQVDSVPLDLKNSRILSEGTEACEMEEEVKEMCNWSEAFFDEGMEEGIQQGVRACIEICQKFGIAKEKVVMEVVEKIFKRFSGSQRYGRIVLAVNERKLPE